MFLTKVDHVPWYVNAKVGILDSYLKYGYLLAIELIDSKVSSISNNCSGK